MLFILRRRKGVAVEVVKCRVFGRWFIRYSRAEPQAE